MRQYYKSDKKRREETKRKKNEEKRARRLNKNVKPTNQTGSEQPPNTASQPSDNKVQDLKN